MSENASSETPETLDKKINDYMKPFIEANNITEMVVIAKDPGTKNLALYYRGHFYDVACIVANINRKFKQQIEKELA